MVAKPVPRATYADLLALPVNQVGEILFGVLHTHPRPAIPHARSASALGVELGGPFDRGRGGPGGWILLDEPELHFGVDPDIVVPDLTGWRRSRMAELPDAPYLTVAPDWICEVLSLSTEAVDRSDKMTIYARERVAWAWLVDPSIQTLEVFQLDGDRWTLLGTWRGEVRVRAHPFDAIELELAALWQR